MFSKLPNVLCKSSNTTYRLFISSDNPKSFGFLIKKKQKFIATIIPDKVFLVFLLAFHSFATVFTNFVPELVCVRLITKLDNML
jgi:hypothetical protein